MITRYTRPEMIEVWTAESRGQCLLEVELAVADAQAARGLIPREAARAIRTRAKFDVERIAEIERVTKHDVIAFVTNVAESVGDMGRFVHFGMTSSDVLDTALSLQVRRAGEVLARSFDRLTNSLGTLARRFAKSPCAGRTHGMHAEATTFGFKLAGHAAEFARARARVERALEQFAIVKLSGAVGTFSTMDPEIERAVGRRLRLKPETVATQVIPRDRHAEVIWSLAALGGAIERLALELRHLQRTEVGEVVENFTPGQKGSSAMPHKKNPISAENLTGLARVLRGYAATALENVALWHERDISHSSVERIVFPDAFLLADYALDRLADVLDHLHVDEARMLANMSLSGGRLFSSRVLLALIAAGVAREDAYALIQDVSFKLGAGESFEKRFWADPRVKTKLTAAEVRRIFAGGAEANRLAAIVNQICPAPPKRAQKRTPKRAPKRRAR